MVYLGLWPKEGSLKIVDFGEYSVCVDCVGHAGAFGYCAALQAFKDAGLVFVEKGTEYGKDYQIWKWHPQTGVC